MAKKTHPFLTELKALLDKYNASVCFSCDPCSDTYGLYGDCMKIKVNGEEVFSTNCWTIDKTDF